MISISITSLFLSLVLSPSLPLSPLLKHKREKSVKRENGETARNWGGVLEIPQTFIFNGIEGWKKVGRPSK